MMAAPVVPGAWPRPWKIVAVGDLFVVQSADGQSVTFPGNLRDVEAISLVPSMIRGARKLSENPAVVAKLKERIAQGGVTP